MVKRVKPLHTAQVDPQRDSEGLPFNAIDRPPVVRDEPAGDPRMTPSPELGEDRRFQDRFWRAQRIAWWVFGLIIVAALAGMTGSGGPLSRVETRTADGRIDSPRVSRWSAADEVRFELSGRGERTIDLSRGFAAHFQVHDIQPAPARVIGSAEGQTLLFETHGEGAVDVVIHVTPENPGIAQFTASLNGGTPQVVTSLILP